jgi:lipopolysaccharide export system protein LptA
LRNPGCRAICLVAVLAMCLAPAAWAASAKGVTVRSNSLKIQEKTGDIQFQGEVEVRMAEVVLNCDLLTVHADAADPSKILSGEASGNVTMTRGSDTVIAQKAVFDLEAGNVELTGVPRLTREETTIEAETIVYSIAEGTASFSGPVRALFKAPGD